MHQSMDLTALTFQPKFRPLESNESQHGNFGKGEKSSCQAGV